MSETPAVYHVFPPTAQAVDPHYVAVARLLEAEIAHGVLRPGDRIASLREMSRRTGRSVTTVLRAYEHLEACGVIESRPRSGFFVRAPAATVPTRPPQALSGLPSLVSTELVSTVLEVLNRPDLINFGYSIPAPVMAPVSALARVTRNLLSERPDLAVPYLMSPGYERLRRQIAARLNSHGARVACDDVIITNGAMEAIHLGIGMLTRPGDTLLMESPTFYGLWQVAEEHGLRVVELPNDPLRGIDPEDVRRAVRRHRVACALLVQNFNNPTGSLMPEAAKREVVSILNQYGIALIEDDIYGELGFSAGRATPLKSYDETDGVLYCGSLSKTLSSGLRVGWIVNARHARELTRRKFTLSCATASLPQLIASRYLETGGYERHLRSLRAALWTSVQRFAEVVLDSFPDGTALLLPQGGFVLWVELPSQVDAMRLFELAAREHVAICPGPLFSGTGQYAHHIRLNCALPWSPVVEQGLRRLGFIARGLARRM